MTPASVSRKILLSATWKARYRGVYHMVCRCCRKEPRQAGTCLPHQCWRLLNSYTDREKAPQEGLNGVIAADSPAVHRQCPCSTHLGPAKHCAALLEETVQDCKQATGAGSWGRKEESRQRLFARRCISAVEIALCGRQSWC